MFFSRKLKKFKNINHCFFSRKGGYSKGIYQSLNCGQGSNDSKGNIIKNLVFCNYAPKLDKFLYWNQQLIAESLGKKGKGFLPLVSTAPKDHHSLVQLYLDGPKDKIFYIFSEKTRADKKMGKLFKVLFAASNKKKFNLGFK